MLRRLPPVALLVGACLLGAGSGLSAQVSPPAVLRVDAAEGSVSGELEGLRLSKIWRFDVEGEVEGWSESQGLAPLAAHAGALVLQNIGPDPQMIGPLLPSETSGSRYLALRCRATATGVTQIYYSCLQHAGFRESQLVQVPMQGDGQWHSYRIDLGPPRAMEARIDRLRIDPLNGEAEVGAKLEVDWIGLYSELTWIAPLLSCWKDGETLVLGFDNPGGRGESGPIDLLCDGHFVGQIPCLDDPGSARVQLDARAWPAHVWVEAWLAGERIWRGRMVKPRAPPPAEGLAIGRGVGLVSHGPDMRVELGPLASLTVRGPGTQLTYYEFDVQAGPDARVYQERLDDPELAEILCTTRVLGTDVRTTIESSAGLAVLRFEGPRMLEQRPHTHALFPGLEYLDAGEESSQSVATGSEAAERSTPAAHKITLPLIAFEYDRGRADPGAWVATLGWDIDGRTGVSPCTPSAEFRSRRSGLSYATVFLPAVPKYVDENARFAARPYPLGALERLELETRFSIAPGTLEEVLARRWTASIPRPPGLDWAASDERVPEAQRGGPGSRAALEQILSTSMVAYTKTLFRPDPPGWKTHISIGEAYAERAEIEALIECESLRSGRPEYAEAIGLKPGTQFEDLIGTAALLISPAARKKAQAQLGMFEPDGSVAYAPTAEQEQTIRRLTAKHGTRREDLGQHGATEAGLIAIAVRPLLVYAACSRDPLFVEAGLRALARMNSFTVPRGGQTWEIHMHTPDLYAAAECTLADIWGWRASGDPHLLDEALRWARTGLAFLYQWEPPFGRRVESVDVQDDLGEGTLQELHDPSLFYADTRRQVAPFASIPAFGTSWYAVTWLGTPVQWCGLAWANAVRELDALRPQRALVEIADGVFRSAANQQCDLGYLAGTLPDSWDLASSSSRQPYIIPDRIVEYAERVLDAPRPDGLEFARVEGSRWTHVATHARLLRIEQQGKQLAIVARFHRGQRMSLIVGGTGGEPASVRLNGVALERGVAIGHEFWLDLEGGRGVLVVRWLARGSEDRIEIDD